MKALLGLRSVTGSGVAGLVHLHDGEDDVRLIADVLEGDRSDHDDHEIESPVRRSAQRIRRRSVR